MSQNTKPAGARGFRGKTNFSACSGTLCVQGLGLVFDDSSETQRSLRKAVHGSMNFAFFRLPSAILLMFLKTDN